MKQVYTAPLFQAEMFATGQTTNRACADWISPDDLTQRNVNDCAWDFGGTMLFTVGNNVCTEDGNASPMGCYNNLTSDATAFHS